MHKISPSFLASNFLKLGEECNMLNNSEADWFHLDVMDGVFVPNISFGLPVIQHIRKATHKTLDVHLMIVNPEKYIDAFARAGANVLSIHLEACTNLHKNIQQIKQLGMKAGVAINPHTPIFMLEDIIEDIDLVNIMSVNPGFGGQSFIPYTLKKIEQLRNLIIKRNLSVDIEIDGGVTQDNAATILNAGATVLVAGSCVFNAEDPIKSISLLKGIAS